MKLHWLKQLRFFFAALSLILIGFVFCDIWHILSPELTKLILFFQFFPSLIGIFSETGIYVAGFIVVIILTFLFGRLYCSFLCPLGVLMDVFGRVSGYFSKSKYSYRKPANYWRYGFLTLTLISAFSGFYLVVDLLDPYSNFGRIFTNFFRPMIIAINNLVSGVVSEFKIYAIQRVDYHLPHSMTIIIPLMFLLLLIIFVVKSGRLYCNTVCPLGTLLGLISKLSVFKISINSSICNSCRKCVSVCKSECINVNQFSVDMSRCVGCMNCLNSCSFSAIIFQPAAKKQTTLFTNVDISKRNMLKSSIIIGAGLLCFSGKSTYSPTRNRHAGSIPVKKNLPCSPPGSISIRHFTTYCTSCHLCVAACPTQVLQPSGLEYGWSGLLQPMLNPKVNFCNFDCTICSEICPTGAIQPLTTEKKHLTQVGKVHFILQSCIVYTNRKDCGACSEHCPTKAVQMVRWKHGLKIPEINPDLCVGCGACEFACPTKPYKAIYVDGNSVHLLAKKPVSDPIEEGFSPENDFPF